MVVIALCPYHSYQLGQEYSRLSEVISIGGTSTSVIPIRGWRAWLPYKSFHLPVWAPRFLWQEIHYSVLEIWRERQRHGRTSIRPSPASH